MQSDFHGPEPWPYELSQGESHYDLRILWPKLAIFQK